MTKKPFIPQRIRPDAPIEIPTSDAYGYRGLAFSIAKTLLNSQCPNGLVVSVNGEWGGGKTSLLNIIKYRLRSEENISLIDFNPWWFDGRDDLAGQFLAQFISALPKEGGSLQEVGGLLAKYASALGNIVSTSTGYPYLDKAIEVFLGLFSPKKKGIQEIKMNIAQKLSDSGRKFIFFIDDIDRLTPEEVRECLKVVKALADFPNVIYVLSFDRRIVTDAIGRLLNTNGDLYLEKIIQAQFVLPPPSKSGLRKKFHLGINEIINSYQLHEFDSHYWNNLYFSGLDDLLRKPRDVVRVINSLSVNYPSVAGEVNTADFIALEFIKIFEPEVYSKIRDNPERFMGASTNGSDRDELKIYHDAWVSQVNESNRGAIKGIMDRLFPRVAACYGKPGHRNEWLSVWRKNLQLCSPDMWEMYFRACVLDGNIKSSDMQKLISLRDYKSVKNELISANKISTQDGSTKLSQYMERLHDFKEGLDAKFCSEMISVFADIGDELYVKNKGDEVHSAPFRWRQLLLLGHLLKQLTIQEQLSLLKKTTESGKALGYLFFIVYQVIEDGYRWEDSRIFHKYPENELEDLKSILLGRVEKLTPASLAEIEDLPSFLHIVKSWREGLEKILLANLLANARVFLPKLLMDFSFIRTSRVLGDPASRQTVVFDMDSLKQLSNEHALAADVEDFIKSGDLNERQAAAARSYLEQIVKL